jgi:hypothetical protein
VVGLPGALLLSLLGVRFPDGFGGPRRDDG